MTTRVALMQIGNKEKVFLIDMLVMNSIPEFDELMIRVFTKAHIVGMSFHSDLSSLSRAYPGIQYYKQITHLYDVQPMYGDLYGEKKGLGLSKIVDAILGQRICKVEQMANWDKRPLRKS